jgi:DNA-binding NarL/FixJ family response regulator
VKILVVDDHPLIRQAVRAVLRQLDANLEVVEAGNCEEALAAADREGDLGLVLLDIRLPGQSGFDALHSLRESHPALPVVVLSASEDPADVTRAIDAGAMGFIPKSHSGPVMLNALRLVLGGTVYLPAEMLRTSAAPSQPPLTPPAALDPATLGLTPRQIDVLAQIVQGKPNKLVCRDLGLAEGTVKIHVTAILKALGVTNRTQAVIAVARLGLKLPPLSGKRPPAPPGPPGGAGAQGPGPQPPR